MEKHTKHIEDLKQYYESELAALKQQLEEAQSDKEKRTTSSVSPAPPGPKNHTDESGNIDKLMSDNGKLRLCCSELQQLHEEDTRCVIHDTKLIVTFSLQRTAGVGDSLAQAPTMCCM